MPDSLPDLPFPGDDDKPCVGVSACLLGRPVRYNGEDRREALVADRLPDLVRVREFCPEVGIGMSVPRPPIQVVQVPDGQRVRSVHAPDEDFTAALAAFALALPDDLDGMLLKARSPSCGVGNTPLMNEAGEQVGLTSGLFASTLQTRFPLMPVTDESHLCDTDALEAFVFRCRIYRAWRLDPRRALVGAWRAALAGRPQAGALEPWLYRLEAASR